MAIQTPPLSVDDQDYYPLHEEDDVPETPPHRRQTTDLANALETRFPDFFLTSNVCIYWERGNTKDYRAPDLFVVKEPLSEPVTRVYQLWKQPPIAFVMEIGSRTTFRQDVGPKIEIYEQHIKAVEYCHFDLDRGVKRLWRLGASGTYEEVTQEANGRLRSAELELEFEIEQDGFLRVYTLEGELLLTHVETAQRLEAAEERLEATEERLEATEERLAETARQAEEEAHRRREAESRALQAEQHAAEEARRRAELERQLAALQVRLAGQDPDAGG